MPTQTTADTLAGCLLPKLVQEADDHFRAFGPLALLGLLVNYNKFEFQNPYQLRLQDFVNKEIMGDIAVALGRVFNECRDEYTTIQNDQVSGWSLGGALSTISLGLTGGSRSTNDPSEEKVKADLAEQYASASVLDPFEANSTMQTVARSLHYSFTVRFCQ